jgi:protein-tyrosine phosphatase
MSLVIPQSVTIKHGIALNFNRLLIFASTDCTFWLLNYFCGMKILMVCLGNICRSPLAEGVLQEKAFKAGLNWSVESAGTNGYHNGEAPHRLSQKVAKLNGIDISNQRSRKLKAEDFDVYDRIYAMATDVVDDIKRIAGKKYNAEKVALLMNEIHPGKNMDVPDPWYGTEPGYHEVFKMIDEACNAIIKSGLTASVRKETLNPSLNLK